MINMTKVIYLDPYMTQFIDLGKSEWNQSQVIGDHTYSMRMLSSPVNVFLMIRFSGANSNKEGAPPVIVFTLSCAQVGSNLSYYRFASLLLAHACLPAIYPDIFINPNLLALPYLTCQPCCTCSKKEKIWVQYEEGFLDGKEERTFVWMGYK